LTNFLFIQILNQGSMRTVHEAFGGVAQWLEQGLHKAKVTGSSPVAAIELKAFAETTYVYPSIVGDAAGISELCRTVRKNVPAAATRNAMPRPANATPLISVTRPATLPTAPFDSPTANGETYISASGIRKRRKTNTPLDTAKTT
jgi:hypothetical protein